MIFVGRQTQLSHHLIGNFRRNSSPARKSVFGGTPLPQYATLFCPTNSLVPPVTFWTLIRQKKGRTLRSFETFSATHSVPALPFLLLSSPGMTALFAASPRVSTRSGPSTACRSLPTHCSTPVATTRSYWPIAAATGRTCEGAGRSTPGQVLSLRYGLPCWRRSCSSNSRRRFSAFLALASAFFLAFSSS